MIRVIATLIVALAIFTGGAMVALLLLASTTAGEPDPHPRRQVELYDWQQDGGL
jgi:hypothetical protein